MAGQEQSYEEGWPARDFSVEARDYLLAEARLRVQEQLSQIGAQDVKAVAIFTASVLLISAAGLLGDLRFDFSALGILAPISLGITVLSWLCVWQAYRARTIGTGVNVSVLRQEYVGASARELQDTALETLVIEFETNQVTIREKTKWLTRAGYLVALQVLLALSVVITAQIHDDQSESSAGVGWRSGTPSVTAPVSPMYAGVGGAAFETENWIRTDSSPAQAARPYLAASHSTPSQHLVEQVTHWVQSSVSSNTLVKG